MYFPYFILSPLEKGGPFICTSLNPLHPRMLCAKFGWNWPRGSGEEVENVKSLRQQQRRQRRRTRDKYWSEKLTSTQVSWKHVHVNVFLFLKSFQRPVKIYLSKCFTPCISFLFGMTGIWALYLIWVFLTKAIDTVRHVWINRLNGSCFKV